MNKPLSTEELQRLSTFTREMKLLRWAQLIRKTTSRDLVMFNGIEHMAHAYLNQLRHDRSVFALAANDPVLKDAGLKGDTAGEAMRFFELTRDDLHMFACDCFGQMSNETMATRIEHIASR